MLSRTQTSIAIFLEEPKEVFAVHKRQLAWLHRLYRQLIWLASNNGVQAENVSRLRDSQDEGFPILRRSGELGLPLAEYEDSMGGLTFDKNDRASRENRGMFYFVEGFQRLWGEGTEEIVGTQVTTNAFSGQTVGRVHRYSSSTARWS